MSRDPHPRSERLQTLQELIAQSPKLKRLGVLEDARTLQLRAGWAKVVGEALAPRTRPLALRKGCLSVAVQGAGWMQELQLLSPQLLKAIQALPGGAEVASLRLTLADKPFVEES